MIPPFEPGTGNLPPGVHQATWGEIQKRYGGTDRRRLLLAGLHAGLASLARAGCHRAYIDGSFVTRKKQPNDFDVCYEADGMDAELLEDALRDVRPPRAAQKHRYRGEFIPVYMPGQILGRSLFQFFQKDRSGSEKGIIEIDLRNFR
jgi:hypothetical protein